MLDLTSKAPECKVGRFELLVKTLAKGDPVIGLEALNVAWTSMQREQDRRQEEVDTAGQKLVDILWYFLNSLDPAKPPFQNAHDFEEFRESRNHPPLPSTARVVHLDPYLRKELWDPEPATRLFFLCHRPTGEFEVGRSKNGEWFWDSLGGAVPKGNLRRRICTLALGLLLKEVST